MPVSKETLDQAKNTAQFIRTSDLAFDKFCKDFAAFVPKLDDAVKKKAEPMMRLYLPKVEPLEARLGDLISSFDGAETLVADLSANAEYTEDAKRFAALEKLAADVTKKQGQLTEMLKKIKALVPQAGETLRAAGNQADEMLRDVARIKDMVADQLKYWQDVQTDMPKLADKARKAHAAGKQKDLTDARLKLIEYGKRSTVLGPLKVKIAKYKAEHPTLDKDGKTELTWMLDDIYQMEEVEKARGELVKDLMKLGQVQAEAAPTINMPKALKATGLPDGAKTALKALLEEPKAKWEKGLEALAKKHGVATSGKVMVASLTKEKAVA
ncbi:MAG: hypothetical protein ACKVQR_01235 [Aquabacterium sp.]